MIKESVMNILKEDHWNQEVYNEWEDVRNAIGDDAMISELYNWLEASDMEDFLKFVKQQYDLDYEEEDDEEEEDPDYPSF